MSKALAFLRRDWLQETSYRFSFVLSLSGVFFGIITFYFLGRMIGPGNLEPLAPYGGDYFAFALVGIAFHNYLQTSLSAFSHQIRDAQMMGTLEILLVTPTPVSALIVYSSLFSFAWTSLRVVVFLAAGLLFGVSLEASAAPTALLILVLTIVAFGSLGLLSASFILVFKRGDPVLFLFSGASALLGGLYYPVSVLPEWLQPASRLLPITYALEAMRRALLTGAPLGELSSEILALAVYAGVGVPLGLWAFASAVRYAKREGTLGQY